MKALSIEESLAWTQRFVMREWKLLVPVALAFVALPQLAMALLLPANVMAALGRVTPQTVAPLIAALPWLAPLAVAVQLIACVGALAIVALTLVPRISVGEALALSVRRLAVFVAAIILVGLGEIVLATAAAIVLQLTGTSMVAAQSLLIGLFFGLSLFACVRLVALAPVVVASRAGPIAAIRLTWHLTAGAFWRIFATLLVYGFGGMVVVFASTFAIGTVFVLVATAAGSRDVGALLSTIYMRAVLALFWAGLNVLVVAVYRQLGGSIRGT